MLLQSENHTARILLPEKPVRAIVYTVMGEDEARQVSALIAGSGMVLCAVDRVDWNRELSPWPAKAVFREDFGGGAQAFLDELVSQIVPACEQALAETGILVPRERVMAGYSLCGLFALWSVCRTDAFTRVASMSGSLWYDGFTERLPQLLDGLRATSVYLSLGDREAGARDPRMARVETATRETLRMLEERGIPATLYMENGGHFRDVPQRIARGLLWTAARMIDPV